MSNFILGVIQKEENIQMSTKEKQMDMLSTMITDMIMLGATSPMVKCLIKYSADIIDLYKEEENHE